MKTAAARARSAALAAALGFATTARADEPIRVVVTGVSEQDQTVARIERELRALGFQVAFLVTAQTSSADIARSENGAAVLRVDNAPPSVSVWIDPARRPPGTLDNGGELRVNASTSPADPAVLALGAVELLRGALLPVDPRLAVSTPAPTPHAPEPHAAQPSADPPATERMLRAHARPSAFLGAGVLATPGGVPAMPIVAAGALFSPTPPFGLALWVIAPAASGDTSSSEGTIHVRMGGCGLSGFIAFANPSSRFTADAGLGVGALLVSASGDAAPGFASGSDTVVTFFPHARLSGSVRIASWAALRIDAVSGFSTPEPVVRATGKPVTSLAEPAVATIAAFEVRP